MSLEQPLKLQDLIINTVSGNNTIFLFIAIIFFSAIAGKFQMPKSIFLTLMAVFVFIFYDIFPALYIVVIVIISIGAFYSLSKLFSKG